VLFDQVESKLKGDSRWEQVALGRAELEDIFRDHVDTHFDKAKKAFFTLVESVVGTKLTTTWEEVMRDHPEIKDDARYLRLSSNAPLRAEKGPQLFAEFSGPGYGSLPSPPCWKIRVDGLLTGVFPWGVVGAGQAGLP